VQEYLIISNLPVAFLKKKQQDIRNNAKNKGLFYSHHRPHQKFVDAIEKVN